MKTFHMKNWTIDKFSELGARLAGVSGSGVDTRQTVNFRKLFLSNFTYIGQNSHSSVPQLYTPTSTTDIVS